MVLDIRGLNSITTQALKNNYFKSTDSIDDKRTSFNNFSQNFKKNILIDNSNLRSSISFNSHDFFKDKSQIINIININNNYNFSTYTNRNVYNPSSYLNLHTPQNQPNKFQLKSNDSNNLKRFINNYKNNKVKTESFVKLSKK